MYRSSNTPPHPSSFLQKKDIYGLIGNGPRGTLQHRCGLCLKSKPQLSRCTACRVVRYCSREHQAEHWQEHKSLCKLVKKARRKADTEDSHFEFVALLGDLCTLDGVTQAVDHMQDLLRRHQDRPSTRNYGPTLMLLLDQDQECYDLVRAWTMDVRNLDLYPHDPDWVSPPTIQPGADVLEDVAYLEENEKHFCLVAAVLLLKMKLLVDVINIVRVRRVASIIEHDNYHPLGHIPHEIWTQVWKQVELQIIRSPLSRQWVTQPDALVKGVLGKLEDHVTRLIGAVHRMNSLFTCCLLAPIDLIENYAISYQQRSTSQMQLYVMLCYSAWWNHVGVLELLQSANSITLEWAKRNPADMLAELMKDPGFVAGRVFKSKQALMPALTGDLTPLYFDLVVEDATSFTRVRPSKMKRSVKSQGRSLWSMAPGGMLSLS